MSVRVAHCELEKTIRGTIVIQNINRLSPNKLHSLGTNLLGGCRISLIIPRRDVAGDVDVQLWIDWTKKTEKPTQFELDVKLQGLHNEGIYFHQSTSTATLVFETTDDPGSTRSGWGSFISWTRLWSSVQGVNGFRMVVNITPTPLRQQSDHMTPALSKPIPLKNMVMQIEGRDVTDVKFYIFSRRRRIESGCSAFGPLPVYANMELIQNQCDYFSSMLRDSSFAESNIVQLDQPPSVSLIDDYDYEDDSDLEDENENDEGVVEPATMEESPQISDDEISQETTSVSASHDHRMGRVITVKDAAYTTWKALIYYLYTSQITFAPLSSRQMSRPYDPLAPIPSAKSMYRLADKLGIPELCALAKIHIQLQLTKEVIIHELFSRFTSLYDEIRDMQLAFLFGYWEDLKGSQDLKDMIHEAVSGRMTYAAPIITTLLGH